MKDHDPHSHPRVRLVIRPHRPQPLELLDLVQLRVVLEQCPNQSAHRNQLDQRYELVRWNDKISLAVDIRCLRDNREQVHEVETDGYPHDHCHQVFIRRAKRHNGQHDVYRPTHQVCAYK